MYELSLFYPKISQVNVRIHELKSNFKCVREHISADTDYWR